MRCHYEVLGIPRDADESQIKTAYRKLALKWHPDKNLDNSDLAKQEFQAVQQAYEVLSDRQERAWYDNHREQILRGKNSNFQDNSLDVFQYFTTSCFEGYDDGENGFYTVYRTVFEEITREDMEYMEDKDEFCEIPTFGRSTSDYEEVVGPFYAFWMCYSTKKSFVWLDPYSSSETRDRKIVKLMEKENKKIRQKAKKERNEEVRGLVAFVKKRDKRVQEYTKKLEAKIAENRQKQETIAKQKRLERKKQLESKPQAEWTNFDNVQAELEQIEKHLAQEFGDEISNDEDDDSIPDNMYCVACNKMFKTVKAFQNHESSKKHKENVIKLKESIPDEEDDEPKLEENSLSELEENGVLSDEELSDSKLKSKQKKKKKPKNVIQLNSNAEDVAVNQQEDLKTDVQSEDVEERKKKPKRKKGAEKPQQNNNEATKSKQEPSTETTSLDEVPKKTNEKTTKRKKEKNQSKTDNNQTDVNHCCVTCRAIFPSKNKLFSHLKSSGHSIYLPSNVKNVK